MADEILKLANYSLAVLGVNRLVAIGEDSSSFRLFDDVYEITRQEFLGSHTWRGATQTLPLVLNETITTPDRWAHAFDVPDNVLQVWKCNDRAETELQPLWEPGIDDDEGTKKWVIFSDQAVIVAKCSIDLIIDEELALLKRKTWKALALAVAAAMAPGWGMTGNELLGLEAAADRAESKAIAVNDQSGKLKKDRHRPLIDIRYFGSSGSTRFSGRGAF